MTDARPLRSDAQRHRAALLEAAAAVFAEQGADAPLELVAQRAGLGRATLHRNFPDRSALVVAAVERQFEVIEARAEDYAREPQGVFTLMEDLVALLSATATLGDVLRRTKIDAGDLAGLHSRILRLFSAPIAKAKAHGLVRGDLTAHDAVLITRMLSAGVRDPMPDHTSPARALSLLLDGMRKPGA